MTFEDYWGALAPVEDGRDDERKRVAEAAWDAARRDEAVVLREGFERGAQWAVLDMAHKNGSLSMIGANGSLGQTLHDLFVPKPKVES
jgi:hypothetical protein